MSVAASTLRLAARRCHRTLASRQLPLQASIARSFTSSASRFEESTPSEPSDPEETDLDPSLSPEEHWASFEKTIESIRHGTLGGLTARIINSNMTREERRRRPPTVPEKKQKAGLANMGEEPEDAMEDQEFEEDDITTLAHAELEQHREFRHYARLMAWEMPLLTRMPILYIGVLGGIC